MSASREKRKRQELYESGDLARDTGKAAQGGLPKWANWLIGLAAIVILVAFVCLMVTNSNVFLNNVTAVTVGDTKFSAGETGYYYWDSVNNVASYYGDYFQYFVDTSKSYDKQQYSEDMTWADFFMSNAESNMQQLRILCDAAEAEGFTIPEESRQQLDESVAALESTALSYGFTKVEDYLKQFYGKTATLESYQAYLEQQLLASAYYTHLLESYTYTDEEIDSYYAEHKNDYDTVSYRVLSLSSSTDGMTADEAKAEAERIAEISAGYEDLFLEEATALNAPTEEEQEEGVEEYDADTATIYEEYAYSSVNTAYAEWLFDEARTAGETHVAEVASSDGATTTFYVVYFLERQVPDYQLVNVRHVLISAEDSSDSTSMAEALEEAEALLAEWEAGEATEESFAEMANANSDDTGSNTNGGLYENVYQGQMVTSFNDWCFDESRQVGDTGIVESTYGYHIMYFSGYSTEYDSYLDYAVDNTLRGNDYTEWYTAKQEEYPISEKSFGMLFVNK